MRNVRIVFTAFMLVISLAAMGCAQNRSTATSETVPATALDNALGEGNGALQIVDPSDLFAQPITHHRKTLRVRAMAYTGCSARRTKRPARVVRGAWGDRLTAGKAVAVSPDLLSMGLEHGDIIRIEGLPGEYRVLDLMHSRHAKAIDIYYGDDHCGARTWGARTITISWQ